VLGPSAVQNLTVRFAPITAGARSATLPRVVDQQHRDAQLAPQIRGRRIQPFQRVREHVLRHDEIAGGRDDDAVRGERAVRDLRAHLVKRGHRRHELPDEPQRRPRIGLEAGRARRSQNLREAFPGDVVGDQRQLRRRLGEHAHTADARECRVPERLQLLDAFPQRGLERGVGRETLGEPQQLERFGTGVVEEQEAIAQAIGEALGVPGDDTRRRGGSGVETTGAAHTGSRSSRRHARAARSKRTMDWSTRSCSVFPRLIVHEPHAQSSPNRTFCGCDV